MAAPFQPSRARSPIDIAAANWADRIDSLASSGVSKKKITQRVVPIMQEDMAKVRQGGQGVGNESAVLQVGSALAGRPLLAPAKEKSSWSPDDIWGDVTGDIADLTWRGIPALARYAVNLPEKAQQAIQATPHILGEDNKWLKAHGYETQDGSNDMAKLRNYARTPLFDLIPGLHTVSSATTPEGRMELLHHPVSTTLDVLPDAQIIAKGVGLAGRVGAAEGGALEAAAEGHPVKAAYRAVVPEARRAAIAEGTVNALRKVGLDPQSFGLARAYDIENRKTRAAFESHLKTNPIIEDIAKLPDDERALLAHEAAYPDQHPELSVEHERLLERVQHFNDTLHEGNPNLTTIERTRQVADPLASTNPIPDEVRPDLLKARDLRRQAVAGDGEGLISQAEQIEKGVLDRVEAPIDPKTGRKSFDFGYDATGASNIGYEGGYYAGGEGRGSRDTTPEQAAEETAYLQERQANMERDYVREEDRRKGARREQPRTGGRRSTDPQSFMEAHLMDLRNGDPNAMEAVNNVYKDLSPEAKQQFLAEQNAEFRRLPEEAKAQREVQAQKAEEAGLPELAAAWRKDVETPGLEPPPGSAEDAARVEKELQEYTKQGGRKGEYKVKAVEEAARARGEGFGGAAPTRTVTDRYVYPADSEVARAHRAMVAAEERAKGVTATGEQRVRGEEALQVARDLKNVDKHAGRVRRAESRVESARQAVGKAQTAAEVGRGQTRTLDNAMTRLQKALDNLEYRKGEAAKAGEKLQNTTNRSIESQTAKMDRAKTSAMEKADAFEEAFRKNPPANMKPILERIIKEKVQRLAEGQPWPVGPDGQPLHVSEVVSTSDYIADATKQIERHDMRHLLSEQEYADIRRSVMQTWQEVADQGYHPVWTHNVDVERAGAVPSTRPLTLRNARLSQVRERVGDLTPHIDDIAVSMSHALAEHLKDMATREYLGTQIQPLTKKWSEIAGDLHHEVDRLVAKGKLPRGLDEAGALQYVLNKHYVEWNPDAIFETQKPRLTGTATVGDTKTYLPRNVAKIADDLIRGPSDSAIAKGAAATSKLYKTSIMAFSLKHMAHILFGGTVFLGLRGGLEEVTNLRAAIKMVKEGEMPVELSRHLDIDTPDQLFQYASGNKMGELYAKSLGGVAKAKYKFDEFVTNVQRADAYLAEESRGLKKGLSPAEAKEVGLRHAYKALVDIDGMNPMERNVLRQVMPFYAFMRHTLKYILTYPIDHPLRAAILSRISAIEGKDWNSGLPEQLQSLFFMGHPDKNGNITGIEMRQFNPFRDTGSYFTLAGFFKSIHPAAALPFTLAGGDKFTGSTNLYPEIQYDERTGNLVAKRPKNAPWQILQTIVPEVGLIDHFAQLTQDMKDLKESDPEAYKARVWSMAFVPFEPKTINVAQEAADIQANRLAVAQQDVSNAFQSGRTGSLQQYQMVPYQGELIPPQNITNVINYLQQIRPDVAPRSVIPQTELSKL